MQLLEIFVQRCKKKNTHLSNESTRSYRNCKRFITNNQLNVMLFRRQNRDLYYQRM